MASTQISVTPQKQKKRAVLISTGPVTSAPESPVVTSALKTTVPEPEDLNKLITVKECNERINKLLKKKGHFEEMSYENALKELEFLKKEGKELSEGEKRYIKTLTNVIERLKEQEEHGEDDDDILDFDNLTDDDDEGDSEDDEEDEDEHDDDEDKVRENERRLKKQKAAARKKKVQKVQGPCNKGQIRDRKSGECRDKKSKSPKCPGQVFDRKTKQCRDKVERKKSPTCLPGQVVDRKTKQCRDKIERKKATSSSSTFPMADPLVKITGTKDPNMLKMYADYMKANKEVVEAQPMPTTPRKRSSPKKTAPKSPPPKSPTKRTSPKKGVVRAPKKILPIVYNPQAIDAAPSGVPMGYAYKPR